VVSDWFEEVASPGCVSTLKWMARAARRLRFGPLPLRLRV
jgi:hypothetical protein